MSTSRRYNARRFALQGLYQWVMTQQNLADIEEQLLTSKEMVKKSKQIDFAYFKLLLHDIPAQLDTIDVLVEPLIDRPIDQLDLIELMVLRIGAYELNQGEVPRKVVINEAVELAKAFGGEDGHKFVNGVLDRIQLNDHP